MTDGYRAKTHDLRPTSKIRGSCFSTRNCGPHCDVNFRGNKTKFSLHMYGNIPYMPAKFQGSGSRFEVMVPEKRRKREIVITSFLIILDVWIRFNRYYYQFYMVWCAIGDCKAKQVDNMHATQVTAVFRHGFCRIPYICYRESSHTAWKLGGRSL